MEDYLQLNAGFNDDYFIMEGSIVGVNVESSAKYAQINPIQLGSPSTCF
jgi:hypothetical protein